jgi:hypothetical protein
VTEKVLIRREVSFHEQLLYGNTQESSQTSFSSEQMPTATLSLQISPTDDSLHTADHPLSSSSSPPASSSSCPSEHTLSHSSDIPVSSSLIPVTSQTESSLSFTSLNLAPLTPRTLHSHPNFQADTPVRMRSLTKIDHPPSHSTSSASTPPLAQAHLIHTSPTSSQINSPSLPETSVPPTQASSPVTADFSPDDPFTYLEALHSPDVARWIDAMTEEVNSLKESKTWELVRLPDGRQAIQCKWVFKTKYHPNGKIDKFKARLVAKGYTQKAGVDYSETFSPMVKFETVRIVMAITAADDLEIVQFDIKTTFLNGDIAELLYMEQPEGFIDKDHPDYVCLLRKALYGLKQASRNWNHKFHQFLLQFGFVASDADPCVYYSYLRR